jgi:hypothetical protein
VGVDVVAGRRSLPLRISLLTKLGRRRLSWKVAIWISTFFQRISA